MKHMEKKRDLYMVFIDLEKTYDGVPRMLVLDSPDARDIHMKYIDIIRDMYAMTKTTVRTSVEIIELFPLR